MQILTFLNELFQSKVLQFCTVSNKLCALTPRLQVSVCSSCVRAERNIAEEEKLRMMHQEEAVSHRSFVVWITHVFEIFTHGCRAEESAPVW